MLRIRLQRIGRKKKPNYRIVVAEHSSAVVKSKYVEQLGYYNPLNSDNALELDKDKLLEWIKKGAKPTNTIARLLKRDGVKGMEPFIIEMRDRKKKKSEEAGEANKEGEAPAESAKAAPAEAPAPKPAEPPAETPVEAPAETPAEEPKPAPSENEEAAKTPAEEGEQAKPTEEEKPDDQAPAEDEKKEE